MRAKSDKSEERYVPADAYFEPRLFSWGIVLITVDHWSIPHSLQSKLHIVRVKDLRLSKTYQATFRMLFSLKEGIALHRSTPPTVDTGTVLRSPNYNARLLIGHNLRYLGPQPNPQLRLFDCCLSACSGMQRAQPEHRSAIPRIYLMHTGQQIIAAKVINRRAE